MSTKDRTIRKVEKVSLAKLYCCCTQGSTDKKSPIRETPTNKMKKLKTSIPKAKSFNPKSSLSERGA
ncbi:MAG TPA: hypothetical protein VK487_06385 [Candidatus Bathyarchaeia archaeon]|nr:hypothetical protein [Candidatus Bathyarchaeia archaeon]